VQSGDTLSAIAARYGISTEALAEANSIADPNSISVGQVLVIPGAGRVPTAAAAQPTATPQPPTATPAQPTATPQAPTPTPVQATATPEAPQVASAPAGPLRVAFIDVGQGDSILIVSPEGKAMLIDGGEADSGCLAYLQKQGIKQLDLVVATHPHSDHIGGLVQVLRSIPVAEVVTNGQPHTTSIYEQFLDAIASAKARYTEVKRGDTLKLGSLEFQVLSPVSATSGDLNSNSLVLRLVYGATSFLFMGDAGKDAEASILSAGLPVQATVLKVGHHGSNSASSLSFLRAVSPQVAVYSAGAGNPYGHPHPETLAALAAVGAQVYGTDVNGTVVVVSDGSSYQVEVEKGTGPRAPPVAQPTEVAAPPTGVPATAAPAGLQIVSVTSPVKPGSSATLQALTAPGATCKITVYYKSGPSKAAGLGDKAADAAGNVSWTWKVGSNTTPGTWRIVVSCSVGGQELSQETSFVVAQ
jgi:competence protein ComEC